MALSDGFYIKVELQPNKLLRYQICYCGFIFFSSTFKNVKCDEGGLKRCSFFTAAFAV